MKLHEVLIIIVVVRLLFFDFGFFLLFENSNVSCTSTATAASTTITKSTSSIEQRLLSRLNTTTAVEDDDDNSEDTTISPFTEAPTAPPHFPPLKAADVGGYHTTTLTHVFFILTSNSSAQQDTLMDTVQNWWQHFPPCVHWNTSLAQRCEGFTSTVQLPKLVIVMASPEPSSLSVSPHVLEFQRSPPQHVSQCFSEVSLAVFQVFRNQTQKARRLIVENVLRGYAVRGERGYGLFLEPHSRPVKAGWLSTVALSVTFPAPAFWLKGGFQRFFAARTERISAHFNSIAIYRLSATMLGNEEDVLEHEDGSRAVWLPEHLRNRPLGEDSFAEFCMGKLFHSMIKFGVFASSEQVSIWHYLLEFKQNYNVIRYQLAHRLVMTPMFQDVQHDGWTLHDFTSKSNEDVILVQGGRAPNLPQYFPLPPTDTLPGKHNRALTHVFLVFPSFQMDKMREAILSSWQENPPCVRGDWAMISRWKGDCQVTRTDERPQLVFIVSRRKTVQESDSAALAIDSELRKQARQALAMPANCKDCFRPRVAVCILPLLEHEDNHVLGSKLIFEYFLRGACVSNKASLGMSLYLEPDTQPIKPRWLSTLSASVMFPAPKSMIKGSIFIGPKTKRPWRLDSADNVAKLYLHINGNAMYHLGRGEDSFADYYFNFIKPAIAIKFNKPTAMDLDIFAILLDPPLHQSAQRNHVMNQLHYTNLIGNFYGYDTLPLDAKSKPFVLAHVSAGVDFMAKKPSQKASV